MDRSIFDSNSEKSIFKRLKTHWEKYVDVYPQIPVKSVIGYENINSMSISEKAKNYLQRTSFDFVICKKDSGIPILVIEFDGIGGGYSTDENYNIKDIPQEDEFRKLKMETKLSVCRTYNQPMIVVSYHETEVLKESEDYISILDAIIGDAIEKSKWKEKSKEYYDFLTSAAQEGCFDYADIELEVISSRNNPIKVKIKEIVKDFPTWPLTIIFPEISGDYLKGKYPLSIGPQEIFDVEISIRKAGIFETDLVFLFNTIGEYCLARKTQKLLGNDREKWRKALSEK